MHLAKENLKKFTTYDSIQPPKNLTVSRAFRDREIAAPRSGGN